MDPANRYISLTIPAEQIEAIVSENKGCLTIQVKLDDEGVVVDAMTGEAENIGTAFQLYSDMGLAVAETPSPVSVLCDVYTVKHVQAIWETTLFDVLVPDEIAPADHEDWIREHLDELLSNALTALRASVTPGDTVEGVDSTVTITKAEGY